MIKKNEYLFVSSTLQLSLRGGVAQWVARLTRNVEVVGSSPIKGPVVSLSKKLPLLLSTGWFQERIRTKINWGPYGRLT